ncbi:hypothetical protein Gotur_011218 [Gossypium turneri]
MSKSTWETKFDVYKKCGWSEEEILDAFKNHPSIMVASEGRIKTLMDFFVNVIGFKASFIAKQFYFLGLSMEKRLDGRGEGEKMSKVRDGGEERESQSKGRDGGEKERIEEGGGMVGKKERDGRTVVRGVR